MYPFTDVKGLLLPRIILFLLYRIGLSRCSGTAGNHSLREGVGGVPVFPPGGVFSAGVIPDMPQRCAVKGVKKSEV